jgi:hypothetical protein
MPRLTRLAALVTLLSLTTMGMASSADAATVSADHLTVCGTRLCFGVTPFYPYGASFYQMTPRSGIGNPDGTIALARKANVNLIRMINFYDSSAGDPRLTPYDPQVWARVDTLIAAAAHAHIRTLLDLADYQDILWKHCINPYTADWTGFLHFVATRTNTVTGATYGSDPSIVLVTFAGDVLPTGSHTFTDARGSACSLSYTTQDITSFYARVESDWKSQAPASLTAPGGLGYLDEPQAGIDWMTIFANPANDLCAIKTYGGMLAYSPTVARYCITTLHKPWFNDEWGYQQVAGDSSRASQFQTQLDNNDALGAAGNTIWNLGYQVDPAGYDVGPDTPLTLGTVQANSRPLGP